MSLLLFLGLTFVVTWSSFTVAAMLWAGTAPALGSVGGLVFLVGVIAPSLVAISLTAREGGRTAVRALVARVFRWRVAVRWYIFALSFMAVTKLTVALVHRLAFGEWPPFGRTPWYVMAAAIVVSTWVQAGEEIGWRGYALPRLAARVGLAPASVLLGAIWACWHLPLFFIPGAETTGQSFPVYLLQVTALSVAMAWLYWRTQGSLLLVMVMHAAINNSKDIVPAAAAAASHPFTLSSSVVSWMSVAVLWTVAAYFLSRMRTADLQHLAADRDTAADVLADARV